mmetsp:Transcript_21566/g.44429  ORF Transcript_21566/g.44429 Transcript_21566/m.44429 type:complete len:414 (+) Transcript_21566:129-1370(+)
MLILKQKLIRRLLGFQAILVASCIVISVAAASPGPIVAILSQPLNSPPRSASNRNAEFPDRQQPYVSKNTDRGYHHRSNNTETSVAEEESDGIYYVAASYVKWLEGVGVRSIVLPYDASPELVEDIFGQVNGLLLPGGAAALPESVKHMWKLARHSNEYDDDYFPIFGTCLGFEFLVQLAADRGPDALQSGFKAENVSLPLDFVVDDDGRTNGYETYEAYEYSARLRRRAISGASGSSLLFPRGARVRQIAATQNVTFNYHQNGIEPDHFHSDAGLTSVFRIISTNEDVSGRPFVSVIEPINPDRHPYYGVQFHPEKNLYENAFYPGTSIPYEDINHSTDAIELGSHLGNFLGDLVRRNAGRSTIVGESVRKRNGKSKRNIHAYTDPSRHPLITTYSTIAGVRFEQVYIVRRG